MLFNNITQSDIVLFFDNTNKYYPLSNTYCCRVFFNGKEYNSAEHAFQCSKFDNDEIHDIIMKAPTPIDAINLAKQYSVYKIPNWNEIRDGVMQSVLYNKFLQNIVPRKVLMSTKGLYLCYDSPNDYYWGYRSDGMNMVGKILMYLRDYIFSKNVN